MVLTGSEREHRGFREEKSVGEDVEAALRRYGYEVEGLISVGTYGCVWKVLQRGKGGEVGVFAVKVVDLSRLSTSEVRMARGEVDTLRRVRHRNIVNLHEVLRFENFMCIVLEYLPGGDLFERLERREMSELEVLNIAAQIAAALVYLHDIGIAHRDIKLENIVFATLPSAERQVVKLVDLGCSRRFRQDEFGRRKCGTWNYMSPQLVAGSKYRAFPSDVWAFGVVLYAMITNRFPFAARSESQAMKLITRSTPCYSEGPWNRVTPELARLVKQMLAKEELDRPTAKSLFIAMDELRRHAKSARYERQIRRASARDPVMLTSARLSNFLENVAV
mmetsp:Transcript_17261/g.35849  ORF Transcript_17261/g.35849 Transcript_17261/m.35849 type:complete len:334 (-) Transcript_17261:323-1324(-)